MTKKVLIVIDGTVYDVAEWVRAARKNGYDNQLLALGLAICETIGINPGDLDKKYLSFLENIKELE